MRSRPRFSTWSADRVEDGGRRRGGGQAESLAELAIEVAPAEGGVVAVGQPEAGLRQAMAHGAQHARLADAGLADEEHLGVLLHGLAHLVDDILLGGREPEVAVGDLLGEGGFGQRRRSARRTRS